MTNALKKATNHRDRNLLYRSLVFATLVWAAVGFGLYTQPRASEPKKQGTLDLDTVVVEARKGFWAKTNDDPTAFFTGALAALTAVLATVGVVQIYFLRRTDETARTSAEAAIISARAAEKALEGTDAPFIFPFARAYDAGKDPSPPGRNSLGFACYELRNLGRSPAIVREVYHGLLKSNFVPPPVSFPPPQTNLFMDTVVAAGESSQTWRFAQGSVIEGKIPLVVFLVGQVRFNDVFGNYFITGFCFAYREADKVFYAIGGTDHNYQRKLSVEEQEVARQRDARAQA